MSRVRRLVAEIKNHPAEAAATAALSAVLLAVPVAAFAGQDPPEQPPSLSEREAPKGLVDEVLDPESDAPALDAPSLPATDVVVPPSAPESNVDKQSPTVTVEGAAEGQDPACCQSDEPEDVAGESKGNIARKSANDVGASAKSQASVGKTVGSTQRSGGTTRPSARVEKSSRSVTTTSSRGTRSTTESGGATRQSSATQKSVSATTSRQGARGSRVAPALGRSYVVRSGDCLWVITRSALGSGVTVVRINDGWQRLWRANASTIGSNPDLILPGQVLRIPREL
jgi:nucleoid-associated protein YgaU